MGAAGYGRARPEAGGLAPGVALRAARVLARRWGQWQVDVMLGNNGVWDGTKSHWVAK